MKENYYSKIFSGFLIFFVLFFSLAFIGPAKADTPEGGTCVSDSDCGTGLFCDIGTHTCERGGSSGAGFGEDCSSKACGTGYVCDSSTKKCTVPQASGGQGGLTYPTYQACIDANKGKSPTDPTYNTENYCQNFPNSSSGSGGAGGGGGTTAGSQGGCPSPDLVMGAGGICLPKQATCTSGICASTSLSDLITKVIQLLLGFAGAIAVVMVVLGGYWYMAAGGNEEMSEKGKKTIINFVLGLIIITMGYAIVTIISNVIAGGDKVGK